MNTDLIIVFALFVVVALSPQLLECLCGHSAKCPNCHSQKTTTQEVVGITKQCICGVSGQARSSHKICMQCGHVWDNVQLEEDISDRGHCLSSDNMR